MKGKYICDKCNKDFASNNSLKRHINRKKPCDIVENNEYICAYCDRNYTSKFNLKTHTNNCKAKKQKEEKERYAKLEKENAELKVALEEKDNIIENLKKQIEELQINQINNITNCRDIINHNDIINNDITNNDITNNTFINYNITINDYRTPNIKDTIIDEKEIKSQFLKYFMENKVNTPSKMVSYIWGDINMPENHSMLLTNPRSEYMLVMKNNEWKYEEVRTVLQFLHKYSYEKTINVLKEYLIYLKNIQNYSRADMFKALMDSIERNKNDTSYYDDNLKHFLEELLNIRDKVESTVTKDKKHKKIQYEKQICKVIENKNK